MKNKILPLLDVLLLILSMMILDLNLLLSWFFLVLLGGILLRINLLDFQIIKLALKQNEKKFKIKKKTKNRKRHGVAR